MSELFELVRLSDEVYELLLSPGAPANCHSLQMAPDDLEPELQAGRWLVLVTAVWSAADLEAVPLAIEFADRHRDVHVGIRPLDDFDEMRTWLPGMFPTRPRTPIWVFMVDGAVENILEGRADRLTLDRHLQELPS